MNNTLLDAINSPEQRHKRKVRDKIMGYIYKDIKSLSCCNKYVLDHDDINRIAIEVANTLMREELIKLD